MNKAASIARKGAVSATGLPKAPTGIDGLEAVTNGGLPAGRPTLVCGGAGCGKTLFAVSFLVYGATRFGEPGVLVSFEENADDLVANVASLGFDLDALCAARQLAIDHVRVTRDEVTEAGEYTLDGLFLRLGHAIDEIGAKRVVLDTPEALFAGLSDTAILRSELQRLFAWLKDKGVTAVVTAERPNGGLTRHGLEEFVSDCVILLDHRVSQQTSARRLRIVKYRGSAHGTNEYPFLIDQQGLSVLPITSAGLNHEASEERVSSGVERLDAMLDGRGFFRGSSILVSGTAGTGKSSLAARFVEAACGRGERCLYFAFEESPKQITRNMRSVGVDLATCAERKLLRFHAARPSLHGLETHLAIMQHEIERFEPSAAVIDPISSLLSVASDGDVHAMLLRMLDLLKTRQITAVFTSLDPGHGRIGEADSLISSLIDTWIVVRDFETGGEQNRVLLIRKSRGMAHSNQIREFVLTSGGIELLDPYLGPAGVLTGSARLAREAEEAAAEIARRQETERRRRELERRREAVEAEIAALRASFEAERHEIESLIEQDAGAERRIAADRGKMAVSRRADRNESGNKSDREHGS